MADTTTPKLGLTKPEVGASSDTWGAKINADFDVVDGLFDTGPVLKLTKGGTGAATAADARTNLGLGTMATQAASAIAVTGGTIAGATITGGSISGITDLSIADGGTGASTAADARTNLSAAKLGANSDITSMSGLTTALSVSQGGTGSNTADGARTSLDVAQAGILSAINNQASNYTLALTDRGDLVDMNLASANTLTVPTNAVVAFPIGTMVTIIASGAGQTSIAPAAGVTLFSYGSKRKLSGQYSMATLIKKATDTWYLAGDLMG